MLIGEGKQSDIFKNFFKDVEEGEKIRISSGEGYWRITKNFEEDLLEISKKAEIFVIIGPIISVDDSNKRDEGNTYLRLAKGEGRTTLFCPPSRQRVHYKIKGKRAVLKEECHKPLANLGKRQEILIDEPVLSKHYSYVFDQFLKVFDLKGVSKITGNWDNTFIYLREKEIKDLREHLKNKLKKECEDGALSLIDPELRLELTYDFLTYKNIVDLLKEAGIFQEEMINS